MKKSEILSLLSLCLIFTSCSKSQNPGSESKDGESIKKEYTISFVTKSDENIDPVKYLEGSIVALDDLMTLHDRDSEEYLDCRFACWTLNGDDITADFTMPSHDISLIAKWRVIYEWTIHYVTGIDGYEIDDTIINEDDGGLAAYEFPEFKDEYHVLKGWYLDEQLTSKVSDRLTESLFNNFELTLYADTECGKTLVRFDAGEGSVDVQTIEIEYGSAIGTLPIAAREGYDFDGWILGNEPIDESYVPGAVTEITLQASWDEADTYVVWNGAASTEFAEGTGTEADPYIINSGADLKLLANKVNGSDEDRTTYASAHYKLNTGIDLSNKSWASIGNAKTKPFMGYFDGNNHKIKNLNVNAVLCYAGLFGYIVDADILNLRVAGKVIEKVDGFMTGLIAGIMFKSTISGCTVSGSVLGYKESVGGIVGKAYNVYSNTATKHTFSTITNCTNKAIVTLKNPNATHNGTAGGIIGTANDHEVKLIGCSNKGKVQGGNNVGGILGKGLEAAKFTISNCRNFGNVVGALTDDNPAYNYAGGIAGMVRKNAQTTITGCYNYGNVKTPSQSAAGIVALLRATMSECYCSNDVEICETQVSEDRLYNNNMTVVVGAAICWQCDVNNGGNITNCGLCNPL